jgi:hypothetical protein
VRIIRLVHDAYRRDRAPWLLAIVALLVYLPASNWGIPAFTAADRCHAWGNDDLVPLPVLADAHNSFVQPKPDWNTAYPWFHFGLLAALYAPYFAILKLTGGLGTISGTYPFGLADPVRALTVLTWIGRAVSLLLSAAMVVGAYHTGKRLFDKGTGVLTAAIAMFLFPVAYYARVGNPDAAALGWLSLTLAVLAACLRDGLTIPRGVWLAIFAALTFGTKEQHGAALLLLIPWVWLGALFRGAHQQWRHWRGRWVAPAITAVVFVVAYAITSGVLVAPARFLRHMGLVSGAMSPATHFTRYPATAAGYLAQAQDMFFFLVDALGWPVLLSALAGVVLASAKFPGKSAFLLAFLSYAGLLWRVRFSHIHYLVPAALTLAPFAAFLWVEMHGAGKLRRLVALAVGIAGIGLLVLQTVDLTHAMLRDSRKSATEWFRDHAPAGSKVVYFGGNHRQPNYAAHIVSVREEVRERVLATIQREAPDFVVVNPDNTTFERGLVEWREGRYSAHSRYLPDEVFEQLADGSLGYTLVAQFQAPPLLAWLNRPFLSYPVVNIPVQVFARSDHAQGFVPLLVWREAPHNAKKFRNRELTRERIQRKFPGS